MRPHQPHSASLTKGLSNPDVMYFSLAPTSLIHVPSLRSRQAIQEELGLHFRAAPMPWAHNIVTAPVYHCS